MLVKVLIHLGDNSRVACLQEVTVTELYEAAKRLYDELKDKNFELQIFEEGFNKMVEVYSEYEIKQYDEFQVKVKILTFKPAIICLICSKDDLSLWFHLASSY